MKDTEICKIIIMQNVDKHIFYNANIYIYVLKI